VIYDVERLTSIQPVNGRTQAWVLLFDDVDADDNPDNAINQWLAAANPTPEAGRYRLIWPGTGSGAGPDPDVSIAEYEIRLVPQAARVR